MNFVDPIFGLYLPCAYIVILLDLAFPNILL